MNRKYSPFTLSIPGSHNREVVHHWNTCLLHSYSLSHEHYKYLMFLCNLHHCLLSFSFALLLPIVHPFLEFSSVTYSAADIPHICTTMPRGKHVRSGEKYLYTQPTGCFSVCNVGRRMQHYLLGSGQPTNYSTSLQMPYSTWSAHERSRTSPII